MCIPSSMAIAYAKRMLTGLPTIKHVREVRLKSNWYREANSETTSQAALS